MKLETNNTKKTNNINNFIKGRIIKSVSNKIKKVLSPFWAVKRYKVYS